MTDNRRRAAVADAVLNAAEALLAHRVSVDDAVASVTMAIAGADTCRESSPRERIAAARGLRRREMLEEISRIERSGKGRAAAMIVARTFAIDAHDPVEIESLARQLRRWRQKKRAVSV